MRSQPPNFRLSLWRDGKWKIYAQKTRHPIAQIAILLADGWNPEEIMIEQRPARFVKMPPPAGPRPRVRLRIVGQRQPIGRL
jgi:hypothetical protein